MLARLLPQGDRSLAARELLRMGHPTPTQLLPEQSCTSKLIGIPQATAAALTAWLQHQGPTCWWYSIPGAHALTMDMLCGGDDGLFTALSREASQSPLLQPVVTALEAARELQAHGPTHLVLGEHIWPLRARAYVMGILNVTPDSFSDGGLYLQPEQAIKRAEEILTEGADIIDVGGQSSRPGATPVPEAVERQRVIPVIRKIVKQYNALVSVDTYRASVAEAALDVGAVLINDISAMRFDTNMAALIAARKASVVLMHLQGTPQTMQQEPSYRHVIDEVYSFLAARLHYALHHGIARQRIILDPGFGFGKTVRHNLDLLHGLAHFQMLGQPLLAGTSRKSFLGPILRREVWDRLAGTITSVIYALFHGAAMVRVHDVTTTVQAVRLFNALEKENSLWHGMP